MSEQESVFAAARRNQESIVKYQDVECFGVQLRIHKKSAWEKQKLEFQLADPKQKMKFRGALVRTYVTDRNNHPFIATEAEEKEMMTLFDPAEVERLIEAIMGFVGFSRDDRDKLEAKPEEYPEGN